MENLHAITVPSGITSVHTNGMQTATLSLAQLQRNKDSMEAELKALSGLLDSHGVDMNTRLITPDGFPRADLDVAQIRTTRLRIIHLRNDYKELMAVIEKRVHEYFAWQTEDSSVQAPLTNGMGSAGDMALQRRQVPLGPPFAKVNGVVVGSPADFAGLKIGDEIRNFGDVNIENHDRLRRVGECVQRNEGHEILVKVRRSLGSDQEKQEFSLRLTPRQNWGGQGLLGCHILHL